DRESEVQVLAALQVGGTGKAFSVDADAPEAEAAARSPATRRLCPTRVRYRPIGAARAQTRRDVTELQAGSRQRANEARDAATAAVVAARLRVDAEAEAACIARAAARAEHDDLDVIDGV